MTPCDLDIWPRDLEINREHPRPIRYLPMRFEVSTVNGCRFRTRTSNCPQTDGRTDGRTFSRNVSYVTLLLFKSHNKIKVSHKRNKRHWTNVNSRKKCHMTPISWARSDGRTDGRNEGRVDGWADIKPPALYLSNIFSNFLSFNFVLSCFRYSWMSQLHLHQCDDHNRFPEYTYWKNSRKYC
jgi:hypothetical protein